MNFFENILSCLGLDNDGNNLNSKIIILNNGAYFEDVKGVKSFSLNKIEIDFKKKTVVILGEELFIKKYCGGDLAICGKINSIQGL